MKRKMIKRIYFAAVVASLQLTACTNYDELLELSAEQTTNADSRTAEPVTALVTLTEAGTLDAKLTAALGDAKLTVQNLTISGPFNATDVMTLHTLTALEKLSMTNVEIKYNSELPSYSFTYSYEYSDGNTYEQSVSEYLTDNEIGRYMFAGMITLKEIELPANVVRIGSNAFEDCRALTTFNLPDKVSVIDWYAFSKCTSLTTFTLPKSLKTINYAFSGSSLTTLTVSEGVKVVFGFTDCTMLKTVNLPTTLKEIGNSAFDGCTALENLTIPEGVVKIASTALARTQISSIKLPSTLQEISDRAFHQTPLTSITIPASVTTLGYGVFENCDQLKMLTIPETVTQISGSLINYCDNISVLFWNSELEVIDIQGVSANCLLYLKSKNNNIPAWGPNWVNVIIDGVAEVVELQYSNNYWSNSNNAFYCPETFKAKKISTSISFSGHRTQLGVASGWRTLVLPFTPTSISHPEKGKLAPFGSKETGTKPFWLRNLTTTGFADATTIKPNKPYIIAMPYNPDIYLDEYNITGNITFEGIDLEIAATPELTADEGPNYYLQPTYKYVEPNSEVYVLNRDWGVADANTGSVFSNEYSYYGVNCFEAYVKAKPGSATRSAYSIDTRSANTRSASQKNTTGVPTIGDM